MNNLLLGGAGGTNVPVVGGFIIFILTIYYTEHGAFVCVKQPRHTGVTNYFITPIKGKK